MVEVGASVVPHLLDVADERGLVAEVVVDGEEREVR